MGSSGDIGARSSAHATAADPGSSLDAFAAAKLRSLERRALRRGLSVTDRGAEGGAARRAGVELISFSCNDYLGLARHPAVVAASVAATLRHGAGAGAARLVTGNHSLYAELERRLAELKGTAAALVFGSGYLANVGVIAALAGPRDLIVMDELCHSCLRAGAALSGARVVEFRHNDTAAAEEALAARRRLHRHCLLLTEGVFSMDGDLAPLPDLADAAARHDAWLLTDDAHGLGVLGAGRGSTFAWPRAVPVPLQMGTLSKAVGAYGGYLCASAPVVELLVNRARTFVYSTGLPPGVVAAATAALAIIAADPARVAAPLARARLFTARAGLPAAASAIVPLVLGAPERALEAAAALERRGFLVSAIRPPTVPLGTARLRFTFSAEHSEEDVIRLADAVAEVLGGV